MFKKEVALISLIILIGMLGGSPSSVFGQNNGGVLNDEALSQEVDQLNSQIQGKKSEIQNLQKRQEQYEAAIKQKQSEKASLNNQIAILDNRLAKAQLDIEVVKTDIDRIKLEIQKTDLDIKNKDEKIEQEKLQIAKILGLLHKRDNVTSLEILLVNDSLADFLSQIKYLEDINESVKSSLDDLESYKRQLEKEKANLEKKNLELNKLVADLEDKQSKLSYEKGSKAVLIKQVGESEKEFQKLLVAAKKEQEAAAADISNIEKIIRAKLAKKEGYSLELNENGLIWPVTKNTITAYFHDPDYPFRSIFEHPAVDIRAAQGTTIKAAASGYVARVKFDGSSKYAYIMIIHGDGLATVYGHVSRVFVHEDEYVTQGQNIGLSGGMPGSPGSGGLTTGPHLHFEVRLNGIPVDPLGYLQ
ncbi:MAG: Murein DD-endopeptidase MepM [Parcubacteria group bacterium ADurb.Bin316]|nr:MAG: Murein DD-endopeptidase MepM [Parcubacteria group bacterium ADurb.Bin316]HOZ56357.1 peptidoglycan DD-metalloendopeptidase family protein [bacterium]